MSGHNVPYQLRTNKYVERQLFFDLLDFVRAWNGSSRYLYASMGGRFLEDFKLVNNRFAIERMVSIELDATTSSRQKFNRLGFIDCRHQPSDEFVDGLDDLIQNNSGSRLVVWLDFAVANKRGDQLGEFRRLVSKLGSGDVAKITLNANYQSYRRRSSALTRKDFDAYLKDIDSPTHSSFEAYITSLLRTNADEGVALDRSLTLDDTEYETICRENLKDQLGEYLPSGGVAADCLTDERFTEFLLDAVRVAALKGTRGSSLHVLPLGAYRYRDGEHQMMTCTVLVADDPLAERVRTDPVFAEWPFRLSGWTGVQEVDVPDLSAKERHHIDSLMTAVASVNDIHQSLPFRLDRRDQVSQSLLASYVKHYRRYPTFARIH